jgi:hypothetical protein
LTTGRATTKKDYRGVIGFRKRLAPKAGAGKLEIAAIPQIRESAFALLMTKDIRFYIS